MGINRKPLHFTPAGIKCRHRHYLSKFKFQEDPRYKGSQLGHKRLPSPAAERRGSSWLARKSPPREIRAGSENKTCTSPFYWFRHLSDLISHSVIRGQDEVHKGVLCVLRCTFSNSHVAQIALNVYTHTHTHRRTERKLQCKHKLLEEDIQELERGGVWGVF